VNVLRGRSAKFSAAVTEAIVRGLGLVQTLSHPHEFSGLVIFESVLPQGARLCQMEICKVCGEREQLNEAVFLKFA